MRKENSKKVSKEQLVNLLATATYGSTWLGACSLRSERHLDNEFSESYLEERCLEEKWADRLLNGGHIAFIDFKDEDEDGKGGGKRYTRWICRRSWKVSRKAKKKVTGTRMYRTYPVM